MDNINLTDKIQSMPQGADKLSERIYTLEFDNQNLLKSYNKLTDRVSFLESNLYTIEAISMDGKIFLMEKFHTIELYVHNEDQRLCESVKSLEIFTGQEIQVLQALEKIVVKSFETLEEIIRTNEKRVKVQGQDLATPIPVRIRNDFPRVLATLPYNHLDKPSSSV